MKKIIAAASLLCAMAVPAEAADYAVINLSIGVDRPAAAVWAKVGPYCALAEWLKATCVVTAGSGDVGSIRHINDSITEIMVSKTPYSYTYTQPDTTILYHGTLEVRPVDAGHSQILYTLLYDQAPLGTAEAQAANRKMRTERFQGAIQNMKALAEAQ